MDIDIVPDDGSLAIDRVWSVSIVIKSFKGRRDVEVHLFRPEWTQEEEDIYDWDYLIGDPIHPDFDDNVYSGRKLVMESFTVEERDQLVEYLKGRYAGKLAAIRSCPIELPVPMGIAALSDLPEGKDTGFINFDKIPNYPLGFPLRGFFDLSQHAPLMEADLK